MRQRSAISAGGGADDRARDGRRPAVPPPPSIRRRPPDDRARRYLTPPSSYRQADVERDKGGAWCGCIHSVRPSDGVGMLPSPFVRSSVLLCLSASASVPVAVWWTDHSLLVLCSARQARHGASGEHFRGGWDEGEGNRGTMERSRAERWRAKRLVDKPVSDAQFRGRFKQHSRTA